METEILVFGVHHAIAIMGLHHILGGIIEITENSSKLVIEEDDIANQFKKAS